MAVGRGDGMANDPRTDVLDRLDGNPVWSSDGEKVGKVADVYFDEATGRPEWALVTTGLFGTRHSFVPITDADLGDEVRLTVAKERVVSAPHIDDDGELTQEEEATLADHYGLHYGEAASESGLPVGTVRRPTELARLRSR